MADKKEETAIIRLDEARRLEPKLAKLVLPPTNEVAAERKRTAAQGLLYTQFCYRELYEAGIISDLRRIAALYGDAGRLALVFKDNELVFTAYSDGTNNARVNDVTILDDRTAGEEFAITHDGAWIQSIYDLAKQRDAEKRADVRRRELMEGEDVWNLIEKPY